MDSVPTVFGVALKINLEGSSLVNRTENGPVTCGDLGLIARTSLVWRSCPTAVSGIWRTGPPGFATRTLSVLSPYTGNCGETMATDAEPSPTPRRLAERSCE